MRVSAATVAIAACLGLSQVAAYAQEPVAELPAIASLGVQCQLVESSLLAFVQIYPHDGPDKLAFQTLAKLRLQMQPTTSALYEKLAAGLKPANAYDNGAIAYSAAVGPRFDRALRACADEWFPDSSAAQVEACVGVSFLFPRIVSLHRKSQSAAQVTAHLQQLEVFPKSVNMEKAVQYYGRFPMGVYQDTDALLRVAGGAKEHCLLGEWQ